MSISTIFNKLKMMNLFDSYSNDPETISLERHLTKLYLLLMSMLIISTSTYAALTYRTVEVELTHVSPDKFLILHKRYSETIRCPCTQETVDYRSFSTFNIDFHPVCSSSYITQTWLDSMFHVDVSIYLPNDVRTILSQFWQMIESLCNLSKRTWSNSYLDFNATLLITMDVYTPEQLEIRIQSSMETSIKAAITAFEENLFLARALVVGNGLISAFKTNWFYEVNNTVLSSRSYQPKAVKFDDGCSCANLEGCSRSVIIYDVEINATLSSIPGLMYDCLITDGALASSFECFYDFDCVTMLTHHGIIPEESRLLSNSQRFLPTHTVDEILAQLMIDRLTMKVDFDAYYDTCNPSFCTYSYRHRPDLMFILTTLISILGTGSTIARLFSQLIMKLISKIRIRLRLRNAINTIGMANIPDIQSDQITSGELRQILIFKKRKQNYLCLIVPLSKKICNFIKCFNLFKSNTQDPQIIYRQRITTRLFLFLMLFLLSGFSIYWFTTSRTVTVIVHYIDFPKYRSLVKNYSDTLQCPCKHIAQEQSAFIRLKPEFHQICSSRLVDPKWYETLSAIETPENLHEDDFRTSLSRVFFRTMHSFCILVERFSSNNNRSFSSTWLINNHVLLEREFNDIVNKLIGTYQESIIQKFTKQLELIRTMVYSSQLSNFLASNVQIRLNDDGSIIQTDRLYPMVEIDKSTGIYTWFHLVNHDNRTYLHEVRSKNDPITPLPRSRSLTTFPLSRPIHCLCSSYGLPCGFYFRFRNGTDDIGTFINRYLVQRCIPTDSVLTSALECWYSTTCTQLIDGFFSEIGITDRFNATPLDVGKPSRFGTTLTLAAMMNELLIENWTINISYETFFNICAPNYCVYSSQARFDWLFVIISIMAFTNGLDKGLKICLPPIVVVMLYAWRTIKQRRLIRQNTFRARSNDFVSRGEFN